MPRAKITTKKELEKKLRGLMKEGAPREQIAAIKELLDIVKEREADKMTARQSVTTPTVDHRKLQNRIKWHPHPKQQLILDAPCKDKVICAGRRFGKTALCSYVGLRALLEGKNILLVAPTYELTRRVVDYLNFWIGSHFKGEMKFANRPLPEVRTKWGNGMDCRSAEQPDQMLGKQYDVVIVDECSRIPKRVHEIYIVPASGKEIGEYFYISTPFGQNWFYHLWIALKEKGGSFQFKSNENPYFSKDKWEDAKEKLPEQIFLQEYEASFLPDAASVFRGVRACIADTLEDRKTNHYYVMGVDLGRHHDFTVLTVMDTYNNSVVYWERFKTIDYPFQKKKIFAIAERYHPCRLIIDSANIGDPIKDDLARQGLMVDDVNLHSSIQKKEIVEKLSIYIEQGSIKIPNIEILIDELEAYGYQLTDSGNVKYGAPTGHDDAVISLALAVNGLQGKASPLTPIQEEIKNRKVKKTQQEFI